VRPGSPGTTAKPGPPNATASGRSVVLRDVAFRQLWAGMTVSRLGSSVAGVATPLIAVQVLNASAFTVSLLTAAAWLPWLLIGLPAGAWIDRVPKRPVMLVCDLVSAALVASVPLAAWLWHLTVAHLLAVAMLAGVASVFFQVAWTAYLPAMFDDDDLVGANSILQGSESATQIGGPAVAGLLVAAVSAVAGLVVDALSFVVSALSLLWIRRPERRPQPAARRGIWRDIGEGIRWLSREPLLRSLTIHGAIGNVALTGYGAITVVFLVRGLGVSTTGVGLLLAASGLGGVAAATATPLLVRRFGAARTMVWCKVSAGICSLLIPLSRPGLGLIAFAVGSGLVAACVVAGNVVAGSFRQAYVPAALLGRVVTSMQFVNLGAIPLGAVLGGVAATALGTRAAIAIMTGGYAVAGLIIALGPWRGRRDLPPRHDPSADPAPETTGDTVKARPTAGDTVKGQATTGDSQGQADRGRQSLGQAAKG
jgi:Transmembrane secretion effector